MIQLVFRFRVRRGRSRPPRVYGNGDLRGPPPLAHPLRVRTGRRERESVSERTIEKERLCVLYILYIPPGGRGAVENSLTDDD